jgi:hypothetical protein
MTFSDDSDLKVYSVREILEAQPPQPQYWDVDLERLEIRHRETGYGVDLERCTDAESVLHWLFHLCRKTWMTGDAFQELVSIFKTPQVKERTNV